MNIILPSEITLSEVLAEYRAKHSPHYKIDSSELSSAIGFLTALSLPTAIGMKQTQAQMEYARVTRPMIRCQRLIAVFERYERI